MPKFVYFGTPDFSTFVLDELERADWLPALVVTTPDKPAGRGLALAESPVKKWAVARGIRVMQPASFDDARLASISSLGPKFGVVAAYGKILPARVLALFPRGILNVHPSLLPRYRGTSPVENQILADEKQVGVSIIVMDEEVDHGPVLAERRMSPTKWPMGRNELNKLLWHAGGRLLAETLPRWLGGELTPRPQDHALATYTKKLAKEDGHIDLATSARENYLKYLAYEGWPGTYFFDPPAGGGKRVKITAATYADGRFIVERVIPEGKREMGYEEYRRTVITPPRGGRSGASA